MLSFIETQLQSAANQDKDESFKSLLQTWKKMNNGALKWNDIHNLVMAGGIPPGPGILQDLMAKPIEPGDPAKASIRANIILEMLDLLQEGDLDLRSLEFTGNSLCDWAVANNQAEVLNHTLVQKEMFVKQVKQMYREGQISEARKMIETMGPTFHCISKDVFTNVFFPTNPLVVPGHFQDDMIYDLLSHNDISLMELPEHHGAGLHTIPSEKVKNTLACQVGIAIQQVSTKTVDEQEVAIAPDLIRRYLMTFDSPAEKADRASLLLYTVESAFRLTPMPAAPPATAEEKALAIQHRADIFKTLFDEGAVYKQATLPHTPEIFQHIIGNKMWEVMEHPNFKLSIEKMWPNHQNMLLSEIINRPGPMVDLTKKDQLRILSLVAPQMNLSRTMPMDPPGHSHLLDVNMNVNTLLGPPMDLAIMYDEGQEAMKSKFKHGCRVLSILLRNNLIDKSNIKPEVPGGPAAPAPENMPFLNPNAEDAALPYNMHDFIMDHEITRAGWMASVRDEELIQSYKMIKGLQSMEPASVEEEAELMEKMKDKSIESPEALEFWRDVMRTSDDIQAHIMAHVTDSVPGPTKTQKEEGVTRHQLKTDSMLQLQRLAANKGVATIEKLEEPTSDKKEKRKRSKSK